MLSSPAASSPDLHRFISDDERNYINRTAGKHIDYYTHAAGVVYIRIYICT
jgi:hypothetical protein